MALITVTHSDSREYYLINTSTLVAYQGKPVSLPPEKSPHGTTFDHIVTVYNITSDNKNRVKAIIRRRNIADELILLKCDKLSIDNNIYSSPHEN